MFNSDEKKCTKSLHLRLYFQKSSNFWGGTSPLRHPPCIAQAQRRRWRTILDVTKSGPPFQNRSASYVHMWSMIISIPIQIMQKWPKICLNSSSDSSALKALVWLDSIYNSILSYSLPGFSASSNHFNSIPIQFYKNFEFNFNTITLLFYPCWCFWNLSMFIAHHTCNTAPEHCTSQNYGRDIKLNSYSIASVFLSQCRMSVFLRSWALNCKLWTVNSKNGHATLRLKKRLRSRMNSA